MDPKKNKKKSFRKLPIYSNLVDKVKENCFWFIKTKDKFKDNIPILFRNFKFSPHQKFVIVSFGSAAFAYKAIYSL